MSKTANLWIYQVSFWKKIREDKATNFDKKPDFESMVPNNLYLWHKKVYCLHWYIYIYIYIYIYVYNVYIGGN